LGFFGYGWRYFTPKGVKEHGSIHKDEPVQHQWEKVERIQNNLLQGVHNFLRSKLHDFTIQIDNPDNLFLLVDYFFSQMKQSLIQIAYQLLIRQHLVQPLDFDIANAINNHSLSGRISATKSMLVDILDRFYFVLA